MKRLILTTTAVLFSTLALWAQTGTSEPATTPGQTVTMAAHSQHHRNKHRNHRHHPQHHTGINARR
ncbi:MAG TPA: hypothetical protein VNZ03_31245 [Terriglobales bacterium]|nr:hypothetical protein [Terriglobales bacterium]